MGLTHTLYNMGFLGGPYNLPAIAKDVREAGSTPGLEKSPERGPRQPTSIFSPGESHGQRSLVGYNPEDGKELDTT